MSLLFIYIFIYYIWVMIAPQLHFWDLIKKIERVICSLLIGWYNSSTNPMTTYVCGVESGHITSVTYLIVCCRLLGRRQDKNGTSIAHHPLCPFGDKNNGVCSIGYCTRPNLIYNGQHGVGVGVVAPLFPTIAHHSEKMEGAMVIHICIGVTGWTPP